MNHRSDLPRAGEQARREFLRFLVSSPLWTGCGCALSPNSKSQEKRSLESVTNVLQFESEAAKVLDQAAYDFVADGSDDGKTIQANRLAFDRWSIRVRRLIDVREVNTEVNLFGETHPFPILLAPIGSQRFMHPGAEIEVARAASKHRCGMIVSTVSSDDIRDISKETNAQPWFQLYPTTQRSVTRQLLRRAEEAGCPAVALTVDTPVVGHRESQRAFLQRLLAEGRQAMGNFQGIDEEFEFIDASLTWDFVAWLRQNTDMKILLKGIVNQEDARLSVEHGVDGIIVSNHGGRQEESLRGTLEDLPEVVEAVAGRIPILIDSGFRRGTDIFKALALGADAICIGRPYIWGLAAYGGMGVSHTIELLRLELVRIMKLAGTRSIDDITAEYVDSRA